MKEILAAVLSENEDGNFTLAFHLDDPVQMTQRIDKLLGALIQHRARLEPQFPTRLPIAFDVTPDLAVHFPAWQWSMTADNLLALNVLHPGLGWMHFRMPDADKLHQELGKALDVQKTLRSEMPPDEDRRSS